MGKKILAISIGLLVSCVVVGGYGCGNTSQPADLVVKNADVFTCDVDKPRAQAVAVEDERITYVGDNKGITSYVGPETKVIDAKGRMLTPGFVDNHSHPLWIGALQPFMTTELYDCSSLDEVYSVVLKFAAENQQIPFVIGLGWSHDYIPGGMPTKEMLDAVISDRPVILWSGGGESGWVNTMALKLLQEKNPTEFQKLDPVVDKETGEPTGMFRHFKKFNPMDFFSSQELGPDIQAQMLGAMKETLEYSLSVGVTTFNDIQIYKSFLPMILEFRDQGGLENSRARCSLYVDSSALEDEKELKRDLDWWKELEKKESDSHLILGDSIKLYVEGMPGTHTSLLLEPYSDGPGDYGEAEWSQEDFDRIVEIVDSMGLQACTHAIGDGGLRRALNSYEKAQEVNGKRDSRHRIEHAEMIAPSDQERMAKLGIYAAMQPAHFLGVDQEAVKFFGLERVKHMMPWRSLEKKGVEISFGSDWCTSPMNPMYGLIISATRVNYLGETDWEPSEKINLEDAIRYWTLGSAEALMLEDDIGSIEVGKYGDLVLFSQNLLEITSPEFLEAHPVEPGTMDDFVDLTIFEGRIVYQKEGVPL